MSGGSSRHFKVLTREPKSCIWGLRANPRLVRHGRSQERSEAAPGCRMGSSAQSGTGSICTPGVAPLSFLSMPLYHPGAVCKEKIEIMPRTKALTAELDIPGQCEQSVEVKAVTIQRDFKSDTCRFHFTGTPIFLAPLAYVLPCWKRSVCLLMTRLASTGKNNQHSLNTSITSISICNQGPMDSCVP